MNEEVNERRYKPCGAESCCYTDDKNYVDGLEAEIDNLKAILKKYDELKGSLFEKDYLAQQVETEERRQKLLELYGIGVQQLRYTSDKGEWFGSYYAHSGEYETDNFKTRREAEDRAIADYESISETEEE